MNTLDQFRLDNKKIVVTGGSGLMGTTYLEAILEFGGDPIIWDINAEQSSLVCEKLFGDTGKKVLSVCVDVGDEQSVQEATKETLYKKGQIDVLINNAAINPHVDDGDINTGALENYSLELWNQSLSVGLTGAFLCSKHVGTHMANRRHGVILNVSSDLGVIAPNQSIYQNGKKPVSYSVVKHGIIGLTKYMATYWSDKDIRVNSISPGGIFVGQEKGFVEKLTKLIPMGRMASEDEYKAAIVFLISDASSYMTGSNLIIDGGRTCW